MPGVEALDHRNSWAGILNWATWRVYSAWLGYSDCMAAAILLGCYSTGLLNWAAPLGFDTWILSFCILGPDTGSRKHPHSRVLISQIASLVGPSHLLIGPMKWILLLMKHALSDCLPMIARCRL